METTVSMKNQFHKSKCCDIRLCRKRKQREQIHLVYNSSEIKHDSSQSSVTPPPPPPPLTMDNLVAAVEFPVTINNQQQVEQIIHYASIANVIISLIVGIATDSLRYLSYAFATQFIVLLLIVAPNFWFNTAPPIQWLNIKY